MAVKPILLHVCCGPCAIMPVLRLQDEGFAVTAWFMNPNIQPLAEYLRRREAVGECAERLGIPVLYEDSVWNISTWLRAVQGRDESPARCAWCCSQRIRATFQKALNLGFTSISTSLLYSRYQPHALIATEGQKCADAQHLEFIYRDFRQDWQAGIDLSKQWGLYRQPYCGCVYSEAERYSRKLIKLNVSSTIGELHEQSDAQRNRGRIG